MHHCLFHLPIPLCNHLRIYLYIHLTVCASACQCELLNVDSLAENLFFFSRHWRNGDSRGMASHGYVQQGFVSICRWSGVGCDCLSCLVMCVCICASVYLATLSTVTICPSVSTLPRDLSVNHNFFSFPTPLFIHLSISVFFCLFI